MAPKPHGPNVNGPIQRQGWGYPMLLALFGGDVIKAKAPRPLFGVFYYNGNGVGGLMLNIKDSHSYRLDMADENEAYLWFWRYLGAM